MSALGQKQTFAVQQPMSALPPIATLIAHFADLHHLHAEPPPHYAQPDDRTTFYDRYLRENYLFGHGQRCWIVCTCIESSPYLKPLSFWAAYFVGPWRIGPQAQLEAP